jgi:ribosomal protein S18 acetylase RimI-like enzyme
MKESVTLRPVVAQDAEFLLAVYASSREQELAQVPWDEAFREAFLRQQFRAQQLYYREHYAGADFLVIEKGGVPIGRFYVARTGDEIRLVDIALVPQYRNAGIGSGLIRDLLAEGASTGRPVRLQVVRSNPALALYERLGFRVVEDGEAYLSLEWTAAAAPGPG